MSSKERRALGSARVVLRQAWPLAFIIWFLALGQLGRLSFENKIPEGLTIVRLFIGTTAVVYIAVPPVLRRLLARTAASRMRKGGLCASCAYPLNGLTPADNALVTCPECGAKWRCDGSKR
jgi:hypothetical protein